MAEKFEVKVEGIKALNEALDSLPGRMRKNVMRGAVRAGAKLLQQTAAKKARVSTRAGPYSRGKGRLADNIVVSTRRSTGDEVVAGIKIQNKRYGYTQKTRSGKVVGRTYDPARIWHFIEFGTEPRKAKKFKKKARVLGFVASRPFIRPTIRERSDDVLLTMQRYCEKRIDKITTKTLAGILLVQGE